MLRIASININPVQAQPKPKKLTAKQQQDERVKEMVKRWRQRDQIEAIKFFDKKQHHVNSNSN
jgi:hypothetical protein